MKPKGAGKDIATESLKIAERWCLDRGEGWRLLDKAGQGGTAPVYRVQSPEGLRTLKLYSEEYSTGEKSRLQEERVELQKKLGVHTCPSLVKIYDGGWFESRLFLLMSNAPGKELELVLKNVPRDKIRHIVDQVAKAALFLKKQGLSHRDIKTANIFVDEDFDVVTLLDISTMRDITDPVGIGTDHGDQLPVVATARYSPPEYLFRLIEPGPELWRLVDTYQLGALLHDMIMREPMFRAEYDAASENRYRFAHSVATVTPQVEADDVDVDMVFLARRALARDWRQRTDLTLDDFLDGRKARQAVALSMLGMGEKERPPRTPRSRDNSKLMAMGRSLESKVASAMRERRVTARHQLRPTDEGATLTYTWEASGTDGDDHTDVEFTVNMQVSEDDGVGMIQALAILRGMPGTGDRKAEVLIPPHKLGREHEDAFCGSIIGALGEAAVKLTKAEADREIL